MNERIRALAEQAVVERASGFREFDANVFAQLIVSDCIDIVENLAPGYADYRSQIEDAFRVDCVATIKRKFGVEDGKQESI